MRENDSIKSITPQTYTIMIAVLAMIKFILGGNHTVIEWTTAQDLPLLLRSLNPDFLTNDFYTNSIVDAPRYVMIAIYKILMMQGLDWYNSVYLLKCVYVIASRVLLFLALSQIIKAYKTPNVSEKTYQVIQFVLFLLVVLGVMNNFQGKPGGWGSVAGYKFVASSTLSYTIGLAYTCLYFSKTRFRAIYLPMLILSATTIHPVVGLIAIIFTLLFKIPLNSWTKQDTKQLAIDTIIGIGIPYYGYLFMFPSAEILNTKEFIYHYVLIHHPFHYFVSSIIDFSTAKWTLSLIVPLIIACKMKDKQLILLTAFGVAGFVVPLIVQYLGTEIFPIKALVQFGPTRFTMYSTIIYFTTILIMINRVEKFPFSIKKSAKIPKLLTSYRKHLTFPVIIATIAVTFFVTIKPPENVYKNGRSAAMFEWIKKNTAKDATFFIRDRYLETFFMVRTIAQRPVFTDYAYTFTEKSSEECSKRFMILKASKNYKPDEFKCLTNFYNIEYLIVAMEEVEKFKDYEPLYKGNEFNIYDIAKFNDKKHCNNNDFEYKYGYDLKTHKVVINGDKL